MKALSSFLCLGICFGAAVAFSAPNQPEKLIFHATPAAFDTLWDHLNAKVLEAELPQVPDTKFAVKRFRAGGLTIICLVSLKDETKRQCDFYVENHHNAYTNKDIGGVIEFKGAAAKAIAANFNLKDLWHLTDNSLLPGKKIWRAGHAIIKPEELFLWEFYYDGINYYAHFSRIWHSDYYVFDMFERKSTQLFDPTTDTFPRKEVVYVSGSTDPKIDELFLEGMRGTLFGDRRARGMGN